MLIWSIENMPRKVNYGGWTGRAMVSPLLYIIVGQGLTELAVGAGRGCLDLFPLAYCISFFFLFPSLEANLTSTI